MTFTDSILCGADFHLSSKYFKYLQEPFEAFIDNIIQKKPLITVISGDYFDGRVNADEDIYQYAIKSLIKISQYTKYLVVIEGTFSHDYNTLNILDTYSSFIPNLYFIKNKKVLNLDGLKILCLPEEYPDNPIEYYKDIYLEKYDYIFGHGNIEGAMLHSGCDNTMLKGFKFNKNHLSQLAKYIIFGHFHKHQFLTDNVLYVGSLGRFKFGEEEEKGFIEITSIHSRTPLLTFNALPTISMDTIVVSEDENIENLLKKYSVFDEVKIKIPNVEGIKKEFLLKLDTIDYNNVKIDYIKEDYIEDNDLEYKDIEKLDFFEQYLFMLSSDIENKKITKKNQLFFTDKILKDTLSKLIN